MIAAGTAAGLSRQERSPRPSAGARHPPTWSRSAASHAGDLRLITGLRPLDHDQARDLVAAAIAAALARMNDVERAIEGGTR